MENPSQESADKVAMTVAMSLCAKKTSDELAAALHQMAAAASAELTPLAMSIIDKAVAVIEPQIATARTALTSAPGLGEEVKSFDQRVARLHEIIAQEREAAKQDALRWIGVCCEL